jgi:predicted dehydrogenase
MSLQTPLSIAVAGAGYIGQAHINAILSTPGFRLTAIVDPSEAGQAVASKTGVQHFESLDALLSHNKPDAVVLATPNALHVTQALQCAKAGVAILLEKPVAITAAEGDRLLTGLGAHAERVLVGHHRAHSSIMRAATACIGSGDLGRLVCVTGSATFYKPAEYFATAPWRSQAGAGPILLNMIHEVHNFRMLCGEVKSVQAMVSHATRGFVVEDTAAITFEFENGALGTFMLSDCAASPRSWEQTSQENKAYTSYPSEDCYVLSGTRGTLSVPTMRLHRYPSDDARSWWLPFETQTLPLDAEDPIAQQMAHFEAVVRGTASPLVSVRDGLRNLAITEAIVRAAQTGQRVNL